MRNDPFGEEQESDGLHIEMPAFTKARGRVVDGIALAGCGDCGGPFCGQCADRAIEKLSAPELAGSTVKGFRFDDEPVTPSRPKADAASDGEFRKSHPRERSRFHRGDTIPLGGSRKAKILDFERIGQGYRIDLLFNGQQVAVVV